MTREGEHHFVDLKTPEGRREVMPYIYRVVNDTKDGILKTPSGFLVEDKTQDRIGIRSVHGKPPTPELVRSTTQEYVVDVTRDAEQNVGSIINVVDYIVFDERNPEKVNPTDRNAGEAGVIFQREFTSLEQEFAAELRQYECGLVGTY